MRPPRFIAYKTMALAFSVNPKGNHSWMFTGRTDAETEAPILWPLDVKNWLIGKDPDDGKDWRLEEKETTEDEMVGWHHRLNGHEFDILWELVMHREAWSAAVHGVTKSWTRLTELNWAELHSRGTFYPHFPLGGQSFIKKIFLLW